MDIQVRGIGPFGAFGSGKSRLKALIDGSIHVSPEIMSIEKDGECTEFSCFKADFSRLSEFIPPKKLRRVDRISSMALLGAGLALEDAGLCSRELENTGIILATGFGALDTGFSFLGSFLDKGDQLSKPTFFSNSVHNAPAAYISIFFKIQGPCLSVSQFDLSVPSAIMTAVQWLKEGRVESVLVGGVDEYSEVMGYAATGLAAKKGAKPVTMGEGGCFFLLSNAGNTLEKGYAKIGKAEIFDPVKTPCCTEDLPVIMGSLGYGAYSSLAQEQPGISFESLYGNFPAGAALDMGVACMGFSDKLFLNKITGKTGFDPASILCLKPGSHDLWGGITLESNEDELGLP